MKQSKIGFLIASVIFFTSFINQSFAAHCTCEAHHQRGETPILIRGLGSVAEYGVCTPSNTTRCAEKCWSKSLEISESDFCAAGRGYSGVRASRFYCGGGSWTWYYGPMGSNAPYVTCAVNVTYGTPPSKVITKALPRFKSASCNNVTFGDPNPGVAKNCFINGNKVASEGQSFNVP